MPNPLLLSLTSGELVKAVTVEMTWKKIKVAIDDFSFKEEVLRTEYASQVLHKLNPLVGKQYRFEVPPIQCICPQQAPHTWYPCIDFGIVPQSPLRQSPNLDKLLSFLP